MDMFKNLITGAVLSEEEYNTLLIKEYTEQWYNDLILLVLEFKEQGLTLDDYVNYCIDNIVDTDFELINI